MGDEVINAYKGMAKATLKIGDEQMRVQFNPSEYQISRSMSYSKKKAANKDQQKTPKPTGGEHASLSVSLMFDDTDYGIPVSDRSGSGVTAEVGQEMIICNKLATLLKYNRKEHEPPTASFIWGKLIFVGKVSSSSVNYTMFYADGTPARARLDLTITGEEEEIQQEANVAHESPNRTKERLLQEQDQLWMLAEREYDDPAMWRVIAEANGIMNPRKLRGAAVLKLPSIR